MVRIYTTYITLRPSDDALAYNMRSIVPCSESACIYNEYGQL